MNKYDGLECPYCHAKLFEEEDIVVCPVCGAPHHRDCYLAAGHCAYADRHGTKDQWTMPRRESSSSDAGGQSRPGRVCPVCGEKIPSDALNCTKCGAPMGGASPFSGPSFGENPFFTNAAASFQVNPDEDIGGIRTGYLAPYIGVSVARYLQVFRKMANGRKISWNWAAFFIPVYWAFYRKCYVTGVVVGILDFIASLAVLLLSGQNTFTQSPMTNVQVAWMAGFGLILLLLRVVMGMFGDRIYRRKVYREIPKLLAAGQTDPVVLAQKGSVSFKAPLIVYVCVVLLQFFGSILLEMMVRLFGGM